MVFFDTVLDKGESSIDNLLVELEFIFFLGQIFLGGVDLDRIEVHQLVLRVVPEQLRVQLCTLESDFVLALPGLINLGVIVCFHFMRFLFHLCNFSFQVFKSQLSFLLLLDDVKHDELLLVLLVDDLLVESVQLFL